MAIASTVPTPPDDRHDVLAQSLDAGKAGALPATGSVTERINSASWIVDATVAGVLVFIVFASGLIHIESFPPLWFDEGWTVCVARTWVELGHYGCLFKGEPAPPSLAAHFPVVASVAAGFALFGVGVWQTRLVGLLFTFAAFLLLYAVTRRLYGRSIAMAGVALLILVPLKWSIHPLYIGRQVLGEMPLLCFLLAGFLCVLKSTNRPLWQVAAVGCWALAWMTKTQVAPFLLVSVAGTMAIMSLRGDWPLVGRLAVAVLGSWGGCRLLIAAKDWLLAGHILPHPPVTGMTEAIALVFVPSIRLETMQYLFVFWPEYPFGLAYAAWRVRRALGSGCKASIEQTVQIMLLLLAGSWLAWFAFLCAGEPRYALPGLFLAAPFTAALLCDLTGGFNVSFLASSLTGLLRSRRLTSEGIKAVAVVLLLGVMGWVALQERYAFRAREDHRDLFAVTHYLNTATPPTAVIETYDSELFLFLNRPYVYAPPRILVDIIRREQGQAQAITYDPLENKPDFLVVGEYGQWAGFYKPLIAQNLVRLVASIGHYRIYEPVRP